MLLLVETWGTHESVDPTLILFQVECAPLAAEIVGNVLVHMDWLSSFLPVSNPVETWGTRDEQSILPRGEGIR